MAPTGDSNITSRFGMNENMATDADQGKTVVGGAFPVNDTTGRTGDSYVHGVQAQGGRGLDAVGDQNELRDGSGNKISSGHNILVPGSGTGVGNHGDGLPVGSESSGQRVPGSATGVGSSATGNREHGSGELAAGAATGAAAEHHHHHHGHHSSERGDRFDRSQADVPQQDFSITDKVKGEVNKTKDQAQQATPDNANTGSTGDYNTNNQSNFSSTNAPSSYSSSNTTGQSGDGTHGVGLRSEKLSGDSTHQTPAAGVPTGTKVWTGEPSSDAHAGGEGDLCETKGFMGRE